VFVAGAGLLAVADWVAVARRSRRLEHVCKPGTLVLLVGAALALDPGARRRAGAAARAWVQANTDVDGETARMAAVIEALPRPSDLARSPQ